MCFPTRYECDCCLEVAAYRVVMVTSECLLAAPTEFSVVRPYAQSIGDELNKYIRRLLNVPGLSCP